MKEISNKPIILDDENDLIGNSIYVDFLCNKISESLKTDYVETIGLFGGWGIGKSSIIETVKKKFKNNENVKFVMYDAWKFSADDFRKNLLITLDSTYKKKLYSTETETNYKLKKDFLFYLLSGAFGIVVIIQLFFVKITDLQSLIGQISMVIIEYLITLILRSLFTETTYSKQDIFSPYEFSDSFSQIMTNKRNKGENVVIVIDDLDRCSYEKVIEILECINGFMKNKNPNNCNYLFLIPVDKNRLKTALDKIRYYSNDEQDKYLDKMFDTVLNVSEGGTYNLFNMVLYRCNELKIKLAHQSIDLLSNFYIQTPRDVNKVLEQIQIDFLISSEKYNKGYITEKINNLEHIKCFIIEHKWPFVYEKLLSITNNLRLDEELRKMTTEEYKKDIDNYSEFVRFVNVSSNISINKLMVYAYLKSNDIYYDKDISAALLSGRIEEIDKISNKEYIVDTFIQTYRQKISSCNLAEAYIERLMISYIYLLSKNIEVNKLMKNISISDICNQYKEYINLFDVIDRSAHVDQLEACLNILFQKFNNKMGKFVNELTSVILDRYHYSETIKCILLNNKNYKFLSNNNMKKIIKILISEKQCIDDNSLEYIFADSKLYTEVIDNETIILLSNNKCYDYLILVSEFDVVDRNVIFSNLINSFHLNVSFKNKNLLSIASAEILPSVNKELQIMINLMKKTYNSFDLDLVNRIEDGTLAIFINQLFTNYSKLSSIYVPMTKFICTFDIKYSKGHYFNVLDFFNQYKKYNSTKYDVILFTILDTIEEHKLIFFEIAASIMYFSSSFCERFINECNLNIDSSLIQLCITMEQNKENFRVDIPFVEGGYAVLSFNHFINNLRKRYNEFNNDNYDILIDYVSFDEIVNNKNYFSDLLNRREEYIDKIFNKINNLDQLYIMKSSFSNKLFNAKIDESLKKLLIINKDAVLNHPLIQHFSTKREQKIISKYNI